MGKGDRKRQKKKNKKEKKINIVQKRKEVKINSFNELKEKPTKLLINHNEGKMSYEIIRENFLNKEHHIHFLKWATKYNELDGTKIKNMSNFSEIFSFANSNDKQNSKFENLKNTEFALSWFKYNKFNKEEDIRFYKINKNDLKKLKALNELPDINSLIPYSFILYTEIELNAPYYSSDDDDFYLIQNPCLKEKVFKVPMVRGSGWKGAIAKAGKELINENLSEFESFVRIFGTGSQEYRELIDNLENKDIKDKIIRYVEIIR